MLSGPSRITSLPSWPAWTLPFLHTCGIYSCPKPSSRSTSSGSQHSILGCRLGSSSKAPLISTRPRLAPLVVVFSSMPNQQLVGHGTTVQRMVSTSVLLWTPTVVSSLSRAIPKARSSQTRSNSAMPIAPSHRHRPKIRSFMVSMQSPVPSRILLCLQPSPNSKLSPIYEISLSHGASLLLLPTTMPTSQVDQGCPTRNLQGWPLLCPPLQLMQRPGPHILSQPKPSATSFHSPGCATLYHFC